MVVEKNGNTEEERKADGWWKLARASFQIKPGRSAHCMTGQIIYASLFVFAFLCVCVSGRVRVDVCYLQSAACELWFCDYTVGLPIADVCISPVLPVQY